MWKLGSSITSLIATSFPVILYLWLIYVQTNTKSTITPRGQGLRRETTGIPRREWSCGKNCSASRLTGFWNTFTPSCPSPTRTSGTVEQWVSVSLSLFALLSLRLHTYMCRFRIKMLAMLQRKGILFILMTWHTAFAACVALLAYYLEPNFTHWCPFNLCAAPQSPFQTLSWYVWTQRGRGSWSLHVPRTSRQPGGK